MEHDVSIYSTESFVDWVQRKDGLLHKIWHFLPAEKSREVAAHLQV
jgi:hypothetical protein